MQTYKPKELANMFLLHTNTIRFYERIGFISKAKRGPNGYRQYTEKHVLQMRLVRYIFAYPFTNHQIRDRGGKLIKKIAEGDLIAGRQETQAYIACINKEIDKAENTIHILQEWANDKGARVKKEKAKKEVQSYTRKEMANLLGTTVEAVRNWERNMLIKTELRGKNNEVLFQDTDLNRMKIIYMLRQTGYSISAIHRCLAMYDKGQDKNLVGVLNTLEQEGLLSAGDAWNEQLKKVKQDAEKIPLLIEEMGQLVN
ncbi:transcriptional regulator [Sporanaerobium hydrogeniformans]|uniref:Transcriptional regulator n=1 Tax=Sporanaerobium hydrogeniformans TaxID=3072179 RepID=A0AC61D929_9FIRM|nr:transcriptional regulator [Sporanaerobium hydrogeniformans]